jgi:hypothetical protein
MGSPVFSGWNRNGEDKNCDSAEHLSPCVLLGGYPGAYRVAAWNGIPPMWSMCPCVTNTFCWPTDRLGHLPMSKTAFICGNIMHVSCRCGGLFRTHSKPELCNASKAYLHSGSVPAQQRRPPQHSIQRGESVAGFLRIRRPFQPSLERSCPSSAHSGRLSSASKEGTCNLQMVIIDTLPSPRLHSCSLAWLNLCQRKYCTGSLHCRWRKMCV